MLYIADSMLQTTCWTFAIYEIYQLNWRCRVADHARCLHDVIHGFW